MFGSGVLAVMKTRTILAVLLAALRARTGRWDVIAGAIDDTARTVRLVAIILARSAPPAAMTALAWFLAHAR